MEHRNARRWFVNRIAGSQLFHLLIQCLGHGIDAFLSGCRFCGLQKRLCRLTVLAVFENVGKFGVAAAVRARLGKTDLDVVVAVPVQLGGRKAKRTRQFTRGAGVVFRTSAHHGGEVTAHLSENHLATGLQNGIRNRVKVAAQFGDFQEKILRHFYFSFCQWSIHSFLLKPPHTSHVP